MISIQRFVKKLYQTFLHPSHPDYKSPHAAEGDSDDEGAPKKKVKRPNTWARLKARLDKVVKRTDYQCVYFSTVRPRSGSRADAP